MSFGMTQVMKRRKPQMVNYEKMTKKELLVELENMQHLADAIEAKDSEIVALQHNLEELKNLRKVAQDYKFLQEICENKDAELVKLHAHLKEAKQFAEEAKAHVVDYEHLKDAIEAKDLEIARLTQDKAVAIAELKKSHEEAVHNMQLELEHLRAQVKSIPEVNKLIQDVNELQKENEKLVGFANRYINMFRNHLKVQQASLENIIEMEGLLTDIVKKEG